MYVVVCYLESNYVATPTAPPRTKETKARGKNVLANSAAWCVRGTDGVRKRKGGEKWKRDPCACLPVEDLTSAAVYQ